jgi:hypothetical protein
MTGSGEFSWCAFGQDIGGLFLSVPPMAVMFGPLGKVRLITLVLLGASTSFLLFTLFAAAEGGQGTRRPPSRQGLFEKALTESKQVF